MLSRSSLALAASAIAGLAGVVASLSGDVDLVPFFIGLTFLGAVGAWALHEPLGGRRRAVAVGTTAVWLGAAGWLGFLLLWFGAACGCSGPPPTPDVTFIGVPATAYHLAGVYLGGALMAVATFSRRLSAS